MSTNQKTMLVAVILAFTAIFSTVSTADDNSVFRSKAKYMKYVGTYYTDNGQTLTINSDGTSTTVQAGMFYFTAAGGERSVTPAQGVWRKVGENEIQITNIRFYTDAAGRAYQPEERSGLIMKASFLAVFDKPVKGQSRGFTVDSAFLEFFASDQNPVTDEPVTVITSDGYRAYRLETVQPGS